MPFQESEKASPVIVEWLIYVGQHQAVRNYATNLGGADLNSLVGLLLHYWDKRN